MIRPETVFDALTSDGARFFTGVPDSLLKHFCAYILQACDATSHVTAANEGNAIALAAGHHLATGRAAVVYMQNSGIGNAVNPLLSLADPGVYSIPMLLFVGWRGEPGGKKDEPQHLSQGSATIPLLEAMRIPYGILPTSERTALTAIRKAYVRAKRENRPVALVVQEGTFSPAVVEARPLGSYSLTREEALRGVVPLLPDDAVIVSTTGKLSRELFELRKESGAGHTRDFLTVGSMGHASQIALGIALAQPERPVYCFDGDGAAIMHLGGWAVIGQAAPRNLRHIVFNNGGHESVGGQPSAGYVVSFEGIAQACGYARAACASDGETLRASMMRLRKSHGPSLLEIRIRGGSRANLARPDRTPVENKQDVMRYLKKRGTRV